MFVALQENTMEGGLQELYKHVSVRRHAWDFWTVEVSGKRVEIEGSIFPFKSASSRRPESFLVRIPGQPPSLTSRFDTAIWMAYMGLRGGGI